MTTPAGPATTAGRALLHDIEGLLGPCEHNGIPEEACWRLVGITKVEAEARTLPLTGEWYRDVPHMDPESGAPLGATRIYHHCALPLTVERLAKALIDTDLIPRYQDYAFKANPDTMASTRPAHLARQWATAILAALEAER